MKKIIILVLLAFLSSNFEAFSQLEVIDSIIFSLDKHAFKTLEENLNSTLEKYKENPDNIPDKIDFTRLTPKIKLMGDKEVTLKETKTLLNTIKSEYIKSNTVTGKFRFALNSNTTDNVDQTQIDLAATLVKGSFPSEFNFDANVNIQFNNGTLLENLSNLSMSYDHHLDDNLTHETYLFVKRSNNNFLNIDQRYEFGGGYIFNAIYSGKNVTKVSTDEEYLKKHLNREGRERYLKYQFEKFLPKDGKQEDLMENFLAICEGDLCTKIDSKLTKDPKFKKLLRNTLNSLKKEGSKIRLALLMGFNYEIEETKENLQLFYQDSIKTSSFESTAFIRFVLAPKIVYSQNDVMFTSRCFIKTAIFKNDFLNTIPLPDGSESPLKEDEKLDYRVEWENSLSIKINDKTAISAKLNYQWINAPKRGYFNYGTDTQEDFQLFSAANRFLNFGIGFEMKL